MRDQRDEEADKRLVRHIIGLHSKTNNNGMSTGKMFTLEDLKTYIMYAKMNVNPRLNEESSIALQNMYIEDRKKVRQMKQEKKSHIPVTVRQLEAIIRLSESIAKMRLSNEVMKADVEEAHRLFNVSTMKAIKGSLNIGVNSSNIDMILKIEDCIKRRVDIGQRVLMERLIEELEAKNFTVQAIHMAAANLFKLDQFVSVQDGKAILRKK